MHTYARYGCYWCHGTLPSLWTVLLTQGDTGASASASRRAMLLTLGAAAASVAGQLVPVLPALAAEGITTVFVAGATGNTGRRVVQQLRGAGFNVRAGVRVSEWPGHHAPPT